MMDDYDGDGDDDDEEEEEEQEEDVDVEFCVFYDWLIRFEMFALSVVLGTVEIQVYHHTVCLKIKKQPGS